MPDPSYEVSQTIDWSSSAKGIDEQIILYCYEWRQIGDNITEEVVKQL